MHFLFRWNIFFYHQYDLFTHKASGTTHGVLAEQLGALSSLTRSGVRPLSSSAAGPLGSTCYPVHKEISLGQRSGYPWFYKKKKTSGTEEGWGSKFSHRRNKKIMRDNWFVFIWKYMKKWRQRGLRCEV